MASYSELELSNALKAWKEQKELIKSKFIKDHIDNNRILNNNKSKTSLQKEKCDDCGDILDEGESGKCGYCKRREDNKSSKRSYVSTITPKHHIEKRSIKHYPDPTKCSNCGSGLPSGEYGQCFYCKRLAEGY